MKKVILSTMLAVAMAGSAQANVITDNVTLVKAGVLAGTALAINAVADQPGVITKNIVITEKTPGCDEGDELVEGVCYNTEVTTTVTVSGTTTVTVPLTVVTTYLPH